MTAATAPDAREGLLETIETQRLGCELAGSPLYASVLDVVAGDVRAEGPCATVLDPVATAPFGDAVLLRFLAALHRLVLTGAAPVLAAHYPSVGGTPHEGLAEAVLDTVAGHVDEVVVALAGGVQTNEVGRSATLLGGYLELARLGLPLRILEVGASAGLNLLVDRYRYRAGARSFGPSDSPLVFDDPWVGSTPWLEAPLVIASRRGSDLAPIDVATEAGRLRLRSFVWPDQAARLARLDAALQVAASAPPTGDRAEADTWVRDRLVDPVDGTCTVVAHSIMFQNLGPVRGRALVAAVEEAGRRATETAPLAWLRMEPGGDQAELRLTRWPGGVTHLLATRAYHGPPVIWRAPPDGLPGLTAAHR